MKTNKTAAQAASCLIELINNASAFVPVSIARQVSEAANALGLHVCGGIHREDTNDIALYIA